MTGPTSSTPPTNSEVAALLQERVLAQEWSPGDRLPSERLLTQEYGVSRPVIREALRSLQERGLISVSPGRGSFVREVRPSSNGGDPLLLVRRGEVTARDLIIARRMLEGEAAALAAQHRTDDDISGMRQILAAFERETALPVLADLDVAFHEAVAIASRNPVIQIMFGSIRQLAQGVVLRSLTDRTLRGVAVPLHAVILEAIAEQDAEAARAAMTKHIEAALDHYGSDLDAPLADVLMRRGSTGWSPLAEAGQTIAGMFSGPSR